MICSHITVNIMISKRGIGGILDIDKKKIENGKITVCDFSQNY